MNKQFLFIVLLLIVGIAAFLLLQDSPVEETQHQQEQQVVEETEESTNPKYGGTFVFGRGGDSVGLDPIQETDGESFKVAQQIFDTLVQYEPDNTDVIPALAKEWEVSDDGTVWTFNLREGVEFHDGTPFNAEAVVFNFERWLFEDHEYHFGGEFPYVRYQFGGFPGIVKEINAVDEYTVEFVLNKPQGPFLNNLAMVCFSISSPTAVKKYGEDYFKNPVGTGPFKFVEWEQDDRITLEVNEDFWDGRAYLDKIIFRSIPDNAARYMELQAGSIDMMDSLSPEDVDSVRSNSEFELLLRPSNNIGYFSMNFEMSPFDNVKVRKAMNYAIDRQSIVDAYYAGLGEPAKNSMPPSLWRYNDDIPAYEYNPEKAKELLTEAGYPDGFEFDFWYMPVPRPYFPQPKLIAQSMQNYFSEIGLTANLVTYDWSTYLDKNENKKAQTFLLGWTCYNGDPGTFLFALLDKVNVRNNYASEELNEVLIEAQTTVDYQDRVELYREAQDIIYDDVPWVPVVHSIPPLASKNIVKNYIPNPTGTEKFTRVWLDI
ncbi:MAG: ABC transporter substrate-binding protein [Halanaerobiaceae bacterium]